MSAGGAEDGTSPTPRWSAASPGWSAATAGSPALYLLTVRTSRHQPRVWTSWKGKLPRTCSACTRLRLGGDALPAPRCWRRRTTMPPHARPVRHLGGGRTSRCGSRSTSSTYAQQARGEIAWHTRTLLAHVNTDRAIVRSRLASTGDAVEC